MGCSKTEAAFGTEQPHRPTIAEARAAAYGFLTAALPDARRVDITKAAPIALGGAAWELEAHVWQPDATLRSLCVDPGRTVLDHNRYMVRLDAALNLLEYEEEPDWRDWQDEERDALAALGELHRQLERGQIDEKEFDLEEGRLIGQIESLAQALQREREAEES